MPTRMVFLALPSTTSFGSQMNSTSTSLATVKKKKSSTSTSSTGAKKEKSTSTPSTTSDSVSKRSATDSNQLDRVTLNTKFPAGGLQQDQSISGEKSSKLPIRKKKQAKVVVEAQGFGSPAMNTRSKVPSSSDNPAMGTRSERKLQVT